MDWQRVPEAWSSSRKTLLFERRSMHITVSVDQHISGGRQSDIVLEEQYYSWHRLPW